MQASWKERRVGVGWGRILIKKKSDCSDILPNWKGIYFVSSPQSMMGMKCITIVAIIWEILSEGIIYCQRIDMLSKTESRYPNFGRNYSM